MKEYQDKPSFTLGTVEVSPLSMAEAYATVAARGIHCNPIIISKITSRTGKKMEMPDANCQRVMDQDVADGVNKMLKSVIDKGTGTRARICGEADIAGKTGTIDSNEAVWFAGYTPEIAGVAMISIDNTKKPVHQEPEARKSGDSFRGAASRVTRCRRPVEYLEGSGSGDAGQEIWKPIMTEYLERGAQHVLQATRRGGSRSASQVTVPTMYGLGISAAIRKLREAGFTVETQYVYTNRPPYGFLGWSPGPGQTDLGVRHHLPAAVAGQGPGRGASGGGRREEGQEEAEAEEEGRAGSRRRCEPPGRPPGPR